MSLLPAGALWREHGDLEPLPHSDESERAVLAGFLLEPQQLARVRGRLDPDDFHAESHELIYRAMLDLQASGATLDMRTLQAHLEQQNILEQVGGIAYLAQFDLDLPDVSRLETYVEIVWDRAGRRRALQALPALERALVRGDDASEALAEVEDAVGSIDRERLRFKPLLELPPEHELVPDLDTARLLPASLRMFVEDEAERMQAPAEFVTVPLICALGATVGRRLGIRPKGSDPWLEVPNLWGALIGRPATMKTPALQVAMRPLLRVEDGLRAEHAKGKPALAVTSVMLNTEEERLKGLLKREPKDGDKPHRDAIRQQLETIARERQAVEIALRDPRLRVTDCTREKLMELLEANPAGLLFVRDELTGFLRGLEQQNRKEDRGFYLETWNGTGSYPWDRINRGSGSCPACVGIVGTAQPGPFYRYVKQAVDGGAGADGLLQRFSLIVWPEEREWEWIDRPADSVTAERVQRVFERAVTLSAAELGAEPGEIPALRFTGPAQDLFREWTGEHQQRIRAAEPEALQAHLAKYSKAVPSLALLFHLAEHLDRGGGRSAGVDVESLKLACAWGDFLDLHARKVYGVAIRAAVRAAHLLLAKIRSGVLVDGDTVRDLYRRGWRGLTDSDVVEAGLKVLAEHGVLRLESAKVGKQVGRSPSPVVRINPEVTRLFGGTR